MSAAVAFDVPAAIAKLRAQVLAERQAHAERNAPQASAASAEREAQSGLVTDSTSGHSNILEIDTRLNRLRKMRYNVIASSNMLNVDATRGGFRVEPIMITLTYRTIEQPQPMHIAEFIKRCRRHLQRRGQHFRCVWVAELQQRGVLHYHVIVWMPHGYRLPKPDGGENPKNAWWPHGWSRIEKAKNAVGYLANYAGKLKSKATLSGFYIPKGFRLFGIGGLDKEDRTRRSWANLPGWLRDHVLPQDRAKRIQGGGFISRLTHEFWPSPFRIKSVVKAGGGAYLSLVSALPEGVSLCSPY